MNKDTDLFIPGVVDPIIAYISYLNAYYHMRRIIEFDAQYK